MGNQDGKIAYIIKQDFQKLEVFTLANDFEEISTLCLEYGEIWDGTMERMSESEFYSLVNKHYFQLFLLTIYHMKSLVIVLLKI